MSFDRRRRGYLFTIAAGAFLVSMPGLAQQTRAVPQSKQQMTLSFAPLVERTSPAVVNIYAQKVVRARSPAPVLDGSAFWKLFRDALLFGYGRERIENSLGSGVIVRPEGIIVTNHHVVAAARGIVVALVDGRNYPARVLLSDKRTDIAVLQIETFGEPLPYIEFGDSDRLKVGDLVLAIGNPFGIGQTVTSGITSALARTGVGITNFQFFIQTDAAINPGNSGGALIAMTGKLMGINTAIYSMSGGSQGLGFAVPSNMVRKIVESVINNRPLVLPWIGVSGQRIPPQIAMMLGMTRPVGVFITGVYEGGPAEKSGLAIGDIVLSVGGIPVADLQALRYRFATQTVGKNVPLTVVRDGEKIRIDIAPVAPPDKPPRDDTWISGFNPLSGGKVASLSPARAEELGLDSAIHGVVVLKIRRGSAAARRGIHEGDIIRAFDGRPISTVQELQDFRVPQFRPWSIRITRAGEDLLIDGR
jgi:Do/DeqQ family serine protease